MYSHKAILESIFKIMIIEWLFQLLGPLGSLIWNYGKIVILLVVGIVVENNYVGRVTTFTNSWAIFFYFIRYVRPIHLIFDLYILFGLVLGVTGIVTYEENQSSGGSYYSVCWLYCSIVTFFIVIGVGTWLNNWLWTL